jgi:hypothetical protein
LGSHIWNYNVDNKVESGISHASIDYSLDGINWTHLGSYDWPLASGSGSYSGFIGPDFQGVEAQYVLITSLDTEAMCQGLGKVAFSAILCPFEGTVCDDGNPETVNDQYNNNCECVGTDFFTNDCEDEIVALGDSTLFNSKHSAVQTVSSVSQIAAQNKVSFVGGDYILLDVGFETGPEAIFIANIDTCDAEGNRLPASTIAQAIEEAREKAEQMKLKKFDVIQKNEKVFEVIYFIDEPGITELVLTHATNGKTYPLFTHEYKNKGVYRKLFPTKKIEPGSYVVSLKSKSDVRQKRITVNALN